jgi:4-amino-4-deoxy-L-arabinose transferase-like glycosyltransferase
VTESANEVAGKTRAKSAARIGWAILIVATLYVCYFSHLGAIGFVGPDEPRYAWVARDMAETGDWVTPRLYGKPWFEKPPLFYWGAALCFKLFGVSEAAARLPSAISALLATLAMAWLALRLYGAETARWLLLLLPTTVGMIGFSHAAATDMPFSGMLTIAMVAAAVVLGLTRNENTPILPGTPWLALVLLGFFLGLAVLAKGPAAVILCGGAVFFWALFTKRWRDAFRLLHPVAIATFCITSLPWYILCARRNPDFLRVFLIEHNFKRYLTPEFQHIQPFWFYILIILLALLPWTVLLLALLNDAWHLWKANDWRNSPGLYFACWAAFTIAFFSASNSKLPGYVLPSVPASGLILASSTIKRLGAARVSISWIGIGVGLSLAVLGIVVEALHNRIPLATDISPAPALTELAVVAILGGAIATFLGTVGRARWALLSAMATVLLLLSVGTNDLWQLDAGVSSRAAIETANHKWTDIPSREIRTYRLPRGFQFGLNFYLHRELEEWKGPSSQGTIIFTAPKQVDDLQLMGIQCLPYLVSPAVVLCEDPGIPKYRVE